jgi:hypothetical protein
MGPGKDPRIWRRTANGQTKSFDNKAQMTLHVRETSAFVAKSKGAKNFF